jgi:hypothetical protein
MRCGKITFDSFNPAVDIARSDVTDHGKYATVRLPASKTDPFRKGVLFTVPSAGDKSRQLFVGRTVPCPPHVGAGLLLQSIGQ